MSDKTLNIRLKNKYDTEANWKTKNPILLAGEMAVSSDKNGKHKIGNGTSKWSDLSYAKAELAKDDVTAALGYTPPTSNTWRGIQNNLTSDATDQSLSAAQGKVLKGLVDGKAPTSHSHSYAGSSSSGGAANSAVKLATSRTINLTTGATGSANFDGSANANISVTNLKESYLSWGGKNFSAGFGCIDAAMIPDLGADRLAFIKGSGITVEYSRDGGTTWTNYGASELSKSALFSTGESFLIGKADTTNKATENTDKYQLRITVDTDACSVYTVLNKFAIYISTNGSNQCWCTIDASLENTPTVFKTFADKISISGWSGWNIINTSSFTTYGNSKASQYGLLRFTFGANGGDSKYIGLQVIRILGFGGVGWNTPSNMAKYGTIYSYDRSQNVVFPANVKAPSFTGSLSGNATTATALSSSAGSATQPVYFSSGKPVACTYTLGKSVPSDAKFTDTNTWRGIQNNLTSTSTTDSLSAAQGKALKELIDTNKNSISTLQNEKFAISGGTITGSVKIKGTAAALPLQVRNIVGSNSAATATDYLYLQYGANAPIMLGNTGTYNISADGSTYSGTSKKATKLSTERTVSGGTDITLNFNYDGSDNSDADINFYNCSVINKNKNNFPYHRFAKLDTITKTNFDRTMTIYISQDYDGGGFGIARLSLRAKSSGQVSTAEVKWLARYGIASDAIQIGLYNVSGNTYADAFFKTTSTYQGMTIRAIASGARGCISRTWSLVNSIEENDTTSTNALTSTESYTSISAAGTKLHSQAYSTIISGVDSGISNYANSTPWSGVTGKPTNATSSASGFMSASDKTNFDAIVKYFDESQYVTSSDISKLFIDISVEE